MEIKTIENYECPECHKFALIKIQSRYETYKCFSCMKVFIKNTLPRVIGNFILKQMRY